MLRVVLGWDIDAVSPFGTGEDLAIVPFPFGHFSGGNVGLNDSIGVFLRVEFVAMSDEQSDEGEAEQ